MFGDIGKDTRKFYYHKNQIWIDDVDTDKMLIINKLSFGWKVYKYFIGHK